MAKQQTEELGENRKSKYKGRVKKLYVLVVLLLIVLAGGGVLGYNKYNNLQKENKRLSDPQEAAKQESQKIKDAVAKLIDVPQGEDPTIATVVDANKLKNQAFFASAQNGDKVLMYAQAKKAILYRPGTNKIIEVAPINIGNNQSSSKKQTNNSSATTQP